MVARAAALASRQDPHAAAAEVLADRAPDVLINNAGIIRGKYFWEHDHEDIDATIAVNTLAPMHATRAFLPGMMASDRPARMMTMASAAGPVSNPRSSVYAASKAAAIRWTDSLRLELAQVGNRTLNTTVAPTYVNRHVRRRLADRSSHRS